MLPSATRHNKSLSLRRALTAPSILGRDDCLCVLCVLWQRVRIILPVDSVSEIVGHKPPSSRVCFGRQTDAVRTLLSSIKFRMQSTAAEIPLQRASVWILHRLVCDARQLHHLNQLNEKVRSSAIYAVYFSRARFFLVCDLLALFDSCCSGRHLFLLPRRSSLVSRWRPALELEGAAS